MNYDASAIEVLKGLEPVRKRPGMYVNDTGKTGFHHLLWELLDNSVDEALAGHATEIEVTVTNKPLSAGVRDNGRGIPIDKHENGRPAAEVVFTTLHAGGKFGGGAYKVAGGLHGVGSSVVNALSSSMRVAIHRDGKLYTQDFSRGAPSKPKTVKADANKHGTEVCFIPDEQIFGKQEFDLVLIRERVRYKSYLTPKVRFLFNGELFFCKGGLLDLLTTQITEKHLTPVTEFPFVLETENLHIALTWTTDPRQMEELLFAFANSIPTPDGGTHVAGLKATVAAVVREFMEEHDLLPRRPKIEAEDVREGLLAVIHVLVENPQFQGQTKGRLNNPEVQSFVSSELRKALQIWLSTNSKQAARLAARVVDAARARTASRTAIQEVRRKSPVRALALPGKLADCSSTDPAGTEIFIVEGDSAGGSAKQGRDREFQAVLPVRGKVLNILDVPLAKIESNQEIADIIQALGCGVGAATDVAALRYGKVIIMTDADVDGHHIATLLLTFFYRALPALLRAGKVFLATPPLYRISAKNAEFWALDEAEKDTFLKSLPSRLRDSAQVSYFKGLGEMPPAMLYATTMDPKARRLEQVEIPDGQELEMAGLLHDLMGTDAKMREHYAEDCSGLCPQHLE